MRRPASHRPLQGALIIVLTALTGGALADETVTLTTFYPQQPAQTIALNGQQPCNGTLGGFRINTTNQGRLLILWSLDVTANAVNTYAQGRVILGGVLTGPVIRSAKLAAVNDSQTVTGYLVVVPAVAATTVDLSCTTTGGANATVNGNNTTLSVIELK